MTRTVDRTGSHIVTQAAAPAYIINAIPFTASALRGITGAPADYGRLEGADLDAFRRDLDKIVYTVMSYSTPVAWWTDDAGWYQVTQRFSATTSKHQALLRRWCKG